MAAPVTFCRIYRDHGPGIEHAADPASVDAVLRSMNAAGDLNPFKVRIRLDDGSTVVCGPKLRRGGR
jgi:hypothetical protein